MSDIGSSHPIVARLLFQSDDILKGVIFSKSINKEKIMSILHDTIDQLIICEKMAVMIRADMNRIESNFN